MLVSTIASLFANGLKDFSGLAIEGLWKDKTYPVVRLDFSLLKGCSSIEELTVKFWEMLVAHFEPHGFRFEYTKTLIRQLDLWFKTLGNNSLVLLIDGYDVPLLERFDDKKAFDAVLNLWSKFFLLVKSNESCLRFFFMTGITKLGNTSIFCFFNNLEDISVNPVYGTILGYTTTEVEKYFGAYVDKAAQVMNVSRLEMLESLDRHYGGYCFDVNVSKKVHCPRSVLSFLKAPEQGFCNYWYTAGKQTTALLQYLETHVLENLPKYGAPVGLALKELSAARQFQDLSLEALLVQAGYLTFKKRVTEEYFEVGYPNADVSTAIENLGIASVGQAG